jgi:digeranylgeranylglycerophospholipid reductase
MTTLRPADGRLDVIVVGGGPAGLYTASGLAGRGLRVRVLEEDVRVGEPVHCTGILGREAFALPGVPRDAVLGWPRVVTFRSPGGHELTYAGPPDEVAIIDRGVFDRALARKAARAGAEIATGARVVGLAIDAHGVRAEVAGAEGRRTISAEVCVLACGARYHLQRALGFGMPSVFLGSAQTELASSADPTVRIFLRRDLVPRGFGWRAPLTRDGAPRAKVGVMAATGSRRALRRLVNELAPADPGSASGTPVVTRLLPLSPVGRTFGDRVLAVGDAAGLVKPTTGGGIYYSLLSAGWAAEAIGRAFERGDFTAAALSAYEDAWRAGLGRELRVGVWFRRLVGRLTAEDVDALTRLAIEDGLMPIVRSAARFNWHHDLIVRAVRHPGVLQILLARLFSEQLAPGRGPATAERPGGRH